MLFTVKDENPGEKSSGVQRRGMVAADSYWQVKAPLVGSAMKMDLISCLNKSPLTAGNGK